VGEPDPLARGARFSDPTEILESASLLDTGRLVHMLPHGATESYDVEDVLVIGRLEGDLRVPADPFMSDRHLRIRRVEGAYVAEDLDSTNGTFVRLTREHELRPADQVEVGGQILEYCQVESERSGPEGSEPDPGAGSGHPTKPEEFLKLNRSAVASRSGTDQWTGGLATGPRLVRIVDGGIVGPVYPLEAGLTVIGRSRESDLAFPDDRLMSGRHASIAVEEVTDGKTGRRYRCVIRDHSRNGVYLRIRSRRPLDHGDQLAVGKQVFKFQLLRTTEALRRVT
jgi:pSer/pThr/pTyr-binding forkhead associated (FHA) protein